MRRRAGIAFLTFNLHHQLHPSTCNVQPRFENLIALPSQLVVGSCRFESRNCALACLHPKSPRPTCQESVTAQLTASLTRVFGAFLRKESRWSPHDLDYCE